MYIRVNLISQTLLTHSGGVILCLFTPWRKGCLRESAAEIRFEGSRVNILSIRSRGASGMMLGERARGEKQVME